MSAPEEYRKGPGRMDVAALLPNGSWMRLANGVRLTDQQVTKWEPLMLLAKVDPTPPGIVAVDGREIDKLVKVAADYVENPTKVRFGDLATAIEKGAHQRGVDEGIESVHSVRSAPQKVAPHQQRMALLRQFAQNPDGLTVKEAADKAGLLGVPNYNSRFATDLLNDDLLRMTHDRRGGSRVLISTAAALDLLNRDGATS